MGNIGRSPLFPRFCYTGHMSDVPNIQLSLRWRIEGTDLSKEVDLAAGFSAWTEICDLALFNAHDAYAREVLGLEPGTEAWAAAVAR
jgi:hypothetical protein